MNGPRLVAAVALVLGATGLLLVSVHGADEEGMRVLVRASARTSLILFSAAFAASALQRLWPSPASRWLLRNRRYVGLSFALSHACHAAALARLRAVSPGFEVDAVTLLAGGLAYLLIAAMTVTSNDRAVAWLGRRRWKTLHTTGGYTILAIFAFDYSGLALESPLYLPFAALVAAVLGLRIAAALRARRRAVVPV